ncbi:YbbR-like domain-containing protein [Lysinibacillus sp. NPDC093210]|uniref:CdaR family protein n=1 Tax=Lysinibacillus sp. NPDC093210 TaxID=3364133 RepID=UPI00382D98D8
MDKMMDSPWVLRIIALFLACLLFFSVRTELSSTDKTAMSEQMEVIQDVPVEVYYDDDNLIVTGIPKTVNVTIKGPKQIALNTKLVKDFSIFVDLNDLLIGQHNVKLQYENISDKLQVTLDPATVNVNIEEKVTQEFRVDPEMNNRLIDEGYYLKGMSANPATVFVTGAKSAIESISYVKATVTGEQGLKQSFSQEAAVKVLDRDLNKLDVTIEPEKVKVRVDIAEYSKELPVSIKETGKAAEGITINQLTLVTHTLKLFGKKSIIDVLTEVPVEIDLSKITESKTYEFDVKLPDGATKVSEQKIKIKADVTKVEKADKVEKVEKETPTNAETNPEEINPDSVTEEDIDS